MQAAIGQKTSAEELGGAKMHAQISGTVDFREPDDESCLQRIRALVDKMGQPPDRAASTTRAPSRPRILPRKSTASSPPIPRKQYDMREIIARIVDGSEFEEYSAEYGETMVCGYARIGGWAVGIVANQKKARAEPRPAPARSASNSAASFIRSRRKRPRASSWIATRTCVPLIFLHDVNGFMVGKEAEWSGIIRAGAKMVNAVANSVVPKITVICGGSFGAGNYAMCGKAYDPRFIFAWPTARYAVMGGDAAAGTLVEIKIKQLEREGKKLDETAKKELLDSINAHL